MTRRMANEILEREVVEIKFAKVKEEAIIPSKRSSDSGIDLYCCFDEDYVEIPPLTTVMINSGIASVIPETHYYQLQERGSTGTKGIKYSAGCIDSGYRGEWMIPITNCNNKTVIIAKRPEDFDQEQFIVYPYSKAIAQAILIEVPKVNIEEISYEELLQVPSERGTGKLGSSGK